MKLSKEMNFMCIVNALLCIVGVIVDDKAMVIGSVIIFVILSSAVEILEAIHKLKEGK